MDHNRWMMVMLFVLAAAVGCSKNEASKQAIEGSEGGTASATTVPKIVPPAVPAKVDAAVKRQELSEPPDDPEKADFKSNAEIKSDDAPKLVGKTAIVSVQLTRADPEKVYVNACTPEKGSTRVTGPLFSIEELTYEPGLRELLRRLPRPASSMEKTLGTCKHSARLYIQITHAGGVALKLSGRVLQVLDVDGMEPAAPPEGVDITSFTDIGLFGDEIVGKVFEAPVHRWYEKTLTGCPHSGGYYSQEIVVENIPPKLAAKFDTILMKEEYEKKRICRVVRVKITKWRFGGGAFGELLDIGKEVRSPDAVDYASFDKLKFAGKKAYKKLAKFKVWRGNTDSKKFVAYPCGDHGGIDWLDVKFKASQKDDVAKIGTDTFGCRDVKVKIMRKDSFGHLQAELLEVGY